MPRCSLRALAELDQKSSHKIHLLNLSCAEVLILSFGVLFTPYFIWTAPVIVYFLTLVHLKDSGSFRSAGPLLSNSLQAGFLYILTAILMTFAVVIMKRRFGRQRPILINENRLIDLRTRETNKAFPSGDTAHSSLFAFFILLHLQSPYWVFVVPLTAFARIYYQCHWIGDTIAGTVVGLVFATISYAICDIEKGAFF